MALTDSMLADLYSECGLSVTHIELLTGRPAVSIHRALPAAGITPRAPDGRSPFMRRWRAKARAEASLPADTVATGHRPNSM